MGPRHTAQHLFGCASFDEWMSRQKVTRENSSLTPPNNPSIKGDSSVTFRMLFKLISWRENAENTARPYSLASSALFPSSEFLDIALLFFIKVNNLSPHGTLFISLRKMSLFFYIHSLDGLFSFLR